MSMARLQKKAIESRNKIEKKFMQRDMGKIARQGEDSRGDAAEREAAMAHLEVEVRKRIVRRESEKSASQGADDFFQDGAAEQRLSPQRFAPGLAKRQLRLSDVRRDPPRLIHFISPLSSATELGHTRQ
jgi:hypothetical protein